MPVLLLLDFDGTITETDTLAQLAAYGYSLHKYDRPPPPSWSGFAAVYADDLSKHQVPFPAAKTMREELINISSRLPVERASVERVERAKMFRGATLDSIKAWGWDAVVSGFLSIRPGVVDCISSVLASGGAVGVISVNWSRAWIEACLSVDVDAKTLENITIIANEVVLDGGGFGTGDLSRRWPKGERKAEGLWTGTAKARAIREEYCHWIAEPTRRTIYVGDSTTDLESLLTVDVGIVMGEGKPGVGVRGICEKHSVGWQTIGKWHEDRIHENELFWTDGFQQLKKSRVLERRYLPH